MNYIIYTDGAYSKAKGMGVFVFIIVNEQDKVVYKMGHKTPREGNNRQELKAIIAAVSKLPDDAEKVRVISDSMYALNTLQGTWMRRNNYDLFDLWEATIAKKPKVEIEFLWVKGHSGDFYNELCDSLCTNVMGYDTNKEYERYKKI